MKGFTLVETMVAITILALAVTGPLFSASRSILAARLAQDQLTASYLAQEGVEYVRMMRDGAYLAAYEAGGSGVSEAAWAAFLEGPSAASIVECRESSCALDPVLPLGTGPSFSLQSCGASACAPLVLSGGRYRLSTSVSGGTPTPYTRSLRVTSVSVSEVRTESVVSWQYRGQPYSVTVVGNLTPWQ